MPETTQSYPLKDFHDKRGTTKPVKSPSVHIARGYETNIPILACGRPIICISDWQCETSTQRYFWNQAWAILKKQHVCKELLERALVIVAGDMASKGNSLRGPKSDAAPDFSWLQESFPKGDILIVYGNHDYMSREHFQMRNPVSGLPCLLPHGSWVGVPPEGTRYNLVTEDEVHTILEQNHSTSCQDQPLHSQANEPINIPEYLQYMTKEERTAYYAKQSFSKKPKASQKEPRRQSQQWDKEHLEQAHLTACFRKVQSLLQKNIDKLEQPPLIRVGAVHGIPSAFSEGIKKVEREEYFHTLDQVCDPSTSPIDILVTHYQPCMPGYEQTVMGDDPRRMYEAFLQSQAYLHVCGHMHLDPPISVVAEGKVVVNVDCRVVMFVPPDADSSTL